MIGPLGRALTLFLGEERSATGRRSARRSRPPAPPSNIRLQPGGATRLSPVLLVKPERMFDESCQETLQSAPSPSRVRRRFRANEVRLQLAVLAYNLGNLWRRLVLPPRIKRWSLTSLQQRLVKTGGRLVKHARYYWLLLAEGHLTRRLFGDMLRRIWALPVPAG